MPPKKTTGATQSAKAISKKSKAEKRTDAEHLKGKQSKKENKTPTQQEPETDDAPTASNTKDLQTGHVGKPTQAGRKRKPAPTSITKDNAPKKEPRTRSRTATGQPSSGSGSGSTPNDPTPLQILNFLLSASALPYCYPPDELSAPQSKTYSLTPPNLLTPFEHLLTAHLLSKPLSHTLGMRSTRTLLNEPYAFCTPEKLHAAGQDGILQALEEARTQHRQKTAEYLALMGERYVGCSGDGEGKAKSESKSTSDSDAWCRRRGGIPDSSAMRELQRRSNEGGDPRATIEYIKKTVKGMGETGAQIFCRRVQACEGWGAALWPYADARSIDALREIGIEVAGAEGLLEMMDGKDGGLGLHEEEKGVRDVDDVVRKAVLFVVVLERAVGCVLEGKVGELRSAAVAAAAASRK